MKNSSHCERNIPAEDTGNAFKTLICCFTTLLSICENRLALIPQSPVLPSTVSLGDPENHYPHQTPAFSNKAKYLPRVRRRFLPCGRIDPNSFRTMGWGAYIRPAQLLVLLSYSDFVHLNSSSSPTAKAEWLRLCAAGASWLK